jgi:hypothetical protein
VVIVLPAPSSTRVELFNHPGGGSGITSLELVAQAGFVGVDVDEIVTHGDKERRLTSDRKA